VLAAIRNAKDGPVEEGSVGAGMGTVAFGWKGGIGTSSRRVPAEKGGWTVGVLVQSNYGGVLRINGKAIGRELTDGRGSIMIVVATDAPVDARNLGRMAARGIMGLARTGSSGDNGSGDYAIAFSAARNPAAFVKNDDMSPLFLATIEATEEAIYNSLLKATTVKDVQALPIEEVLRALGR
ncbi:MAG TPA: P1 family peptidase, partial [Vicinamibacterales bacterium]|nr:P1 family peptidase [Vicinamibacterales bacterium]